ncbi:hypothetical protein GCM10023354_02270 [Garicola koreensis]
MVIDGLALRLKVTPSGIQTFYPHFGPGVMWCWDGIAYRQETFEQMIENQRRVAGQAE